MANTPDGGNAFPIQCHLADHRHGLTVRDFFAAKAMQAEIITTCSDATPEAAEALVRACEESGMNPVDRIAFNAYEMADAMLRARAK